MRLGEVAPHRGLEGGRARLQQGLQSGHGLLRLTLEELNPALEQADARFVLRQAGQQLRGLPRPVQLQRVVGG